MVLDAVLGGTGDLPGWDNGECEIGFGVARSEKPGRRVQGAERRVVRVSELRQLFRRGGGVVRMGGDDVVLGGFGVSSLHVCQFGAESTSQPQLVFGKVWEELSQGEKSCYSFSLLTCYACFPFRISEPEDWIARGFILCWSFIDQCYSSFCGLMSILKFPWFVVLCYLFFI